MKVNEYYKEAEIPGHVKQISLDQVITLEKQMKESVCKIYSTNLSGTGFFCALQNMKELNSPILYVLMTNYHVLKGDDIKPNKKIKISLSNREKNLEILIDSKRKTFINEKYDITMIEMKQSDGIKKDSFIEIDKDIYKDNFKEIFKKKSIYLLHYPKGNEIFKSEEVIRNISLDNYTIEHFCDSNFGSSGGPLINLKNNKVIGIHKGFNGKINVGTILREPIEKFFEQIKTNIQITYNEDKNKELYKNNNIHKNINDNRSKDKEQKINLNMNYMNMMNYPMSLCYTSYNISKTLWRLEKEYYLCSNDDDLKQIGCSFGLENENNLFKWRTTMLGAIGSPYEGGLFTINILFPSNYPFKGPEFRFKTKIYHLNIDFREKISNGHVSLSRLNEWSSSGKVRWIKGYNVKNALFDIFWLFYNQGIDSAYDLNMAYLYMNNPEKFNENARKWVKLYARS